MAVGNVGKQQIGGGEGWRRKKYSRVKGWVHFAALPPVGCVASDKLLTLSERQLTNTGQVA